MTAAGPVTGSLDVSKETRELFEQKDWSSTALGPVTSWSPVLRTMVQSCVNSSFPIVIHWGPSLTALYNDAFARLLGGKHPTAFGRPAQETWPEAWDVVGARLTEVVESGRTLQAEDEQRILLRNGYPEECYFSYSHSPIEDVDGSTAGVFTIATETTTKILYERRMRVVRDLGGLSIAGTGNTGETCRAVLRVLATARETMPFAVAFLRDDSGVLQRVADYGLAPDGSIPGLTDIAGRADIPRRTDVPGLTDVSGLVVGGEPGSAIDRVLATGRPEEINGLREAHPDALLPGPLGPLAPETAVVLPLTVSGRTDPIGVLTLGVNPYRPLNSEYRAYITLIARQMRVALTDSVAYEVERLRSQVLADLDRVKMEFVQNVSHELRTPLTLLLAPLRNLLSTADDRPQTEQLDLQAAIRAAERLRTMVDALLGFSGAEAGTVHTDLVPTDLSDLTVQTCSMFRATVEHLGLQFTVQVPDRPLTVPVDRAMWSTIVTNLLSNAVKYTRRGGIRVGLEITNQQVVLTVADSGQGIAADQQRLVFDRFHRAPGTAEGEGAGIGLAVVADLVAAHHGDIELTSALGQGSTFTITLPLTAVRPVDPESEPSPAVSEPDPAMSEPGQDRAGSSEPEPADRPVALLVEDDADLREFLVRLLLQDGWTVRAFSNAEAALDSAADPTLPVPGIVITDVVLPGRDGLSLVQQLRQRAATARIPMIVLTARHGDDATAEGLAAGADDYVTKPFSTQELLARVHANHSLARTRESAVADAQTRGDQLRAGLESNRVIGTAIGILMANHRLDAAQAFQLLTYASQHSNRKLRVLAAETADGGGLPLRQTLMDELLLRVNTNGQQGSTAEGSARPQQRAAAMEPDAATHRQQ